MFYRIRYRLLTYLQKSSRSPEIQYEWLSDGFTDDSDSLACELMHIFS